MLQLRASANLLVTFELLATGYWPGKCRSRSSRGLKIFKTVQNQNCELWDVDVEKS
jgi:hypothetical protein